MEVEQVRDVIAFALEYLQDEEVKAVPLGNRVYLYAGDSEFEIVIKTMDPKGSSRLDRKGSSP